MVDSSPRTDTSTDEEGNRQAHSLIFLILSSSSLHSVLNVMLICYTRKVFIGLVVMIFFFGLTYNN
jgi:hypothetical protein